MNRSAKMKQNEGFRFVRGVICSNKTQDNVQSVIVIWIARLRQKRHFELTEFKVVDTHCPKNKW